jgi:hypothetical protein
MSPIRSIGATSNKFSQAADAEEANSPRQLRRIALHPRTSIARHLPDVHRRVHNRDAAARTISNRQRRQQPMRFPSEWEIPCRSRVPWCPALGVIIPRQRTVLPRSAESDGREKTREPPSTRPPKSPSRRSCPDRTELLPSARELPEGPHQSD